MQHTTLQPISFFFFFFFSLRICKVVGGFPHFFGVFFLFELSTHGQRPKPEPAKSTSEEQKYLLCVARYFGIYYDVDSPRPCISVLALWLQSWTNCCHSDSVKVRFPLATHQRLSKVPHRFSVMHFLYGNSAAPWNKKYIRETSVPREAQGAQRSAGAGWLRLCSPAQVLHWPPEVQGLKSGWQFCLGGKKALLPDPSLCHG